MATPKTIDYHAQYAGCKSWVPLRRGDEVDDDEAMPVVEDAAFEQVVDRIQSAVGT